jgi:hypothetical protein
MDIHSFLPYEDTIVLKEKTDFNISTPYVFIEIKNDDETELMLTLKQNIELSGGEVKSEAFIYADITEFIKTKYNYDLYVTPSVDGYKWHLFKHENLSVTHIESSITYKKGIYAMGEGIRYFIEYIC